MRARTVARPDALRNPTPRLWCAWAAVCLVVLWPASAATLTLPAPEALRTTMLMPAAVVRVVEPHL